MNEKTLLEKTRKYTLWAVLGAAAVALVLNLLKVWDLLGDGHDGPTFWDRLDGTAGLVLVLGGGTLLALLVASRVKRDDAAAKPAAGAKAPTASASAPAAKTPAKATPAKKPAAKAPAKKAAPKK